METYLDNLAFVAIKLQQDQNKILENINDNIEKSFNINTYYSLKATNPTIAEEYRQQWVEYNKKRLAQIEVEIEKESIKKRNITKIAIIVSIIICLAIFIPVFYFGCFYKTTFKCDGCGSTNMTKDMSKYMTNYGIDDGSDNRYKCNECGRHNWLMDWEKIR